MAGACGELGRGRGVEHLIVRLMGPEGGASWQLVDGHGAPLPEWGDGDLDQAAALSEGRKVVVLVPSREVFRARLNLPARGRRAAVKGVRYALEDRIAGDVEDMHFAVGPASGDHLDVAAIERQRMVDWLDRCSAAGLAPVAAYDEGDALPELPNAAVALLEPDRLLLRNGSGQLVAAEPAELAGLVEILCAEHAGEDAAPFRLVIYCDSALESTAREAMSKLAGREVELRLLEQGVMAQMAAEALSSRAINLMQGEFRPRDGQSRPLTQVFIGLLAVALLYPAYLGLDGWRAAREFRVIEAAVNARLEQLMPDVSEGETLRAEWRRRIASADLSAAASSDEFLRLLQALDTSGGEKTRVIGLSYGNGSTQVQLRAADMDTLEETRRRLRSSGYSVLIQTAAPEPNGAVLGELNLRNERDR